MTFKTTIDGNFIDVINNAPIFAICAIQPNSTSHVYAPDTYRTLGGAIGSISSNIGTMSLNLNYGRIVVVDIWTRRIVAELIAIYRQEYAGYHNTKCLPVVIKYGNTTGQRLTVDAIVNEFIKSTGELHSLSNVTLQQPAIEPQCGDTYNHIIMSAYDKLRCRPNENILG